MAPATARVRLTNNGEARVETAAHDVGTGAYTVIAQIAAQKLGLAVPQVSVVLGDSDLPPSPVSGGSITTASVCNAVAMACDKIRARLAPSPAGETPGAAFARLAIGTIEEFAEFIPRGSAPEALQKLYKGSSAMVGGVMDKDNIMLSFGAEFVEFRKRPRNSWPMSSILAHRAVNTWAA